MKQWAKRFLCCRSCGSTERHHRCLGLCHKCWWRQYVRKRRFGGNYERVLKGDHHRCRRCGSTLLLVVHHKNRIGRRSPNPDNRMCNLLTLCTSCHIKEHDLESQAARGYKKPGAWCPKLGLDVCVECNKDNRPHNAKGQCTACYKRLRFKKYDKPRRFWDSKRKIYRLIPMKEWLKTHTL